MKKSFLLAGGFALALFFAACGDDSSSGNNVDQETDESSSSVEDSTDVSSSSAEYKDPTWPEGARAATLDDLKKYYLVKIKGETFHLGTGSKSGMFSLWGIDESNGNPHLALLLIMSDFKDGIIKMNSSNTMDPLVLDEKIATNKILKDIMKSSKDMELSFIVNGDKLMYRVDKGDFAEAEVEQLKADQSLVTDAANFEKKRLACTVAGNDTTQVYSFYKGRYIMERVVGKDTVSWNAGYVDTYRGYTFFVSKFATGADLAMMTRQVTASMDSIRGNSKCVKSDFKYSDVDVASLKGDWATLDKSTNTDWEFNLKAPMQYTLVANAGMNENKSGAWDVYGDVLLLKVEKMLKADERKCASAIKGNVTGISEKGFTYNHSDKCSPAMPKAWEVPVYEE